MSNCTLLNNNFDYFIQFLLALICFITLYLKWKNEKPQRILIIWLYDSIKQGIGSIIGHLINIGISTLLVKNNNNNNNNNEDRRYNLEDIYVIFKEISQETFQEISKDINNENNENNEGNSYNSYNNYQNRKLINEQNDQCKWYFMNYLSDSTIGVIFNITILSIINWYVIKNINHSYIKWFQFGYYGKPPSIKIWLGQLSIWLVIVFCGKIFTFTIFYLMSHQIDQILSNFFHVFDGYPKVELVFVMIIVPFLLNSLQFWVQDSFLMFDPSNVETEQSGLKTGLLRLKSSSESLSFQPISFNDFESIETDREEDWAL